MKAILIILVIALGAGAYHFQSKSSDLERSKQIQIDAISGDLAAAREETAEALNHASELRDQITAMQAELAEARTNSVTDELLARQLEREQSNAAQAAVAAADKAAQQTEAEKQLARDQALQVYNRNKAALDEQLAQITNSLNTARAALKIQQDNTPTFDEQGRTWRNGKMTTVGVRTSQADRDQSLKKYQAELAQAAGLIAASEAEMVRLNSRRDELEITYAAVLAKLQ